MPSEPLPSGRGARFVGKVAVVTGGGTGIGRSIALLLAGEGARVVVSGRRPAPLREAEIAIVASGGEARAIPADVTEPASVQSLVATTLTAFGRVDVLVNNAGSPAGRLPVGETPDEEWEASLRGNLSSVFLCSKYFLPSLIATRGNIVNLLSFLSHRVSPNFAPYASAKAGAEVLTRSLALEYGPQGVRCNGVRPARVETEMNHAAIEIHRQRGTYDRMVRAFPIGFMGDTGDVARAVAFLASDEARWITGAILPVDGGMSA